MRCNQNERAIGIVISPIVWFTLTAGAEFCFPYKVCTIKLANRQQRSHSILTWSPYDVTYYLRTKYIRNETRVLNLPVTFILNFLL